MQLTREGKIGDEGVGKRDKRKAGKEEKGGKEEEGSERGMG